MLIHGNCSSSVFYLKLMERLEADFEIAAPDLRCFGASEALFNGDREFFRTLLKNSYVVQGYAMDAAWEEKMVDSIGSTKVGDGMYPGDFVETEAWPGVGAGTKGVCNTMAPDYCDLSPLSEIHNKFKIAWIRGSSDLVVSDNSLCDFGQLGLLGIVPGWPGMASFPPQPMVSQMRYVLEKFAQIIKTFF